MHEDVLIAPSILGADFLHLGDELESVANADYLHCDVMDGSFVPNLSFGPGIISQVAAASNVPLDVHLMISNPDAEAVRYAKAGANIVTFHVEASTHAHRTLYSIKDAGARAGVVLNPATPVVALDSIIEDVDMVLIMSVNPGFGGQAFIPTALRKLRQLQALCFERGVDPLVEVDGGITEANIGSVVAAGANVIVAGSCVFNAPDHAAMVKRLRELGRKALGEGR